MTFVVMTRERFGQRHAHREYISYEDEGRDWGDASVSQGMPKITNKLPETRKGAWGRSSHSLQKELTIKIP